MRRSVDSLLVANDDILWFIFHLLEYFLKRRLPSSTVWLLSDREGRKSAFSFIIMIINWLLILQRWLIRFFFTYYYEFINFNIFDKFQSFAIIILFKAQIVPSLASGNLFRLAIDVTWWIWIASLQSGVKKVRGPFCTFPTPDLESTIPEKRVSFSGK